MFLDILIVFGRHYNLVEFLGEGDDGFRENGNSDDDGLNGHWGGFDDLDGFGGDLDDLDGFGGNLDNMDGLRGDLHNVDGLRHDGFGGDSGSNGDGASLSSSLVDVQDDLHQRSAGSSDGSNFSGSGSDNSGAGDDGLLSDNTTVGKGEVNDGWSNRDGVGVDDGRANRDGVRVNDGGSNINGLGLDA